MSTPKFAETHNLVAFLKKPTESEGFEQIIDFLNADYNVNDEAQLQALVDKKKFIITEASIRRDLRFENEGGIYCLSNEVIFEQLPLMGRSKNQGGNKGKKLKFLHQVVRFLMRKVLDLEEANTAQAKEVASLNKRAEKLEQKRKSRTSWIKRLRNGRMIDKIKQDVEITLVDDIKERMNEEDMFRLNDLDGDEVVVDVSASKKVEQSVKVVEKETLIEINAPKLKAIIMAATTVIDPGTRPKEKGIVMQEPSETPSLKPIDSSQQPSKSKDKDCELGARLQEEEREELTIEEKSRLCIEAFVPMDTELVKGSKKSTEGSEKAVEGSKNLKKKVLKEQKVDYEVDMAYDLLRLIRKQINEG
nr:hypothetical protein [Tanacetum cinerariifolium]